MDTDDVSREAYKAIITEADKFDHNLTLQFGLLAENCESEEEYLLESENLIDEINEMSDEELDDLFFDEKVNSAKLKKALVKIKTNIDKVKLIPENKRKFDW